MKKFKYEWININATDDPLLIINLETNQKKKYGIEGFPWRIASNELNSHKESGKISEEKEQLVLEHIFTHFETDVDFDTYDLDKWFDGAKTATVFENSISGYFNSDRKMKVLQLNGFEVVLFPNGTYYLGDTSGA